MLYVAGRDADCAVFDIAMRLVAADGGDPQRILLEPFGKRDDRLREGGRKQQRAPFRRGGVENLFQIVPKPKVQHIVGLVQDRSEEYTSELQSLRRITYSLSCLKNTKSSERSKHYTNVIKKQQASVYRDQL